MPSPILPVFADLTIASTALPAMSSATAISILTFGQKIHRVLAAAVDLGVALLAAESLDLGYGHALDAGFGQGLLHLFQFERFDDGDDQFHADWGLDTKSGYIEAWVPRGLAQARVQLETFEAAQALVRTRGIGAMPRALGRHDGDVQAP